MEKTQSEHNNLISWLTVFGVGENGVLSTSPVALSMKSPHLILIRPMIIIIIKKHDCVQNTYSFGNKVLLD